MELKAVEIARFFRVDQSILKDGRINAPDLCIVMVYHQALNISVKNFQIALKGSYWIYSVIQEKKEL